MSRADKLRGRGLGGRGRLRVHVEDRGYETACWIWTAPLNSRDTYGRHLVNGQLVCSYRAFYEAKHGPVEPGLQLDHLCRNPACVNPAHLEPVTATENVRRSRATKLTFQQVGEIREARRVLLRGRSRLWRGERERIAAQYGVTPANVSAIWRGSSWKEAA